MIVSDNNTLTMAKDGTIWSRSCRTYNTHHNLVISIITDIHHSSKKNNYYTKRTIVLIIIRSTYQANMRRMDRTIHFIIINTTTIVYMNKSCINNNKSNSSVRQLNHYLCVNEAIRLTWIRLCETYVDCRPSCNQRTILHFMQHCHYRQHHHHHHMPQLVCSATNNSNNMKNSTIIIIYKHKLFVLTSANRQRVFSTTIVTISFRIIIIITQG